MPITIDRPIVLTDSQVKKFNSLVIKRNPAGKLVAEVTFDIFNDSANLVSIETLQYPEENFNAFWEAFNSGKFLYEELVKNEESITVPNEIEEEFLN